MCLAWADKKKATKEMAIGRKMCALRRLICIRLVFEKEPTQRNNRLRSGFDGEIVMWLPVW